MKKSEFLKILNKGRIHAKRIASKVEEKKSKTDVKSAAEPEEPQDWEAPADLYKKLREKEEAEKEEKLTEEEKPIEEEKIAEENTEDETLSERPKRRHRKKDEETQEM